MADARTVLYEVRDRIAYITLNRPEKKNAINRAMRKELGAAYMDVKHNPEVWVAIITGNGTVFTSGMDLSEKGGQETGEVLTGEELYSLLRSIYKPIVLAVNGPALAQGSGIALISDIVIMSEKGSFGWPQPKVGISSVSGPTDLVHAMPWPIAMAYLMGGDYIPPAECLRFGLCNEVVPHDQVMATAERWARKVRENAPIAVRAIKEAARRGYDMPVQSRQDLSFEIANRILSSEDTKEGIAAFKEKRKPVWQAR
jgi:enoyl-CoA hydratase/carnithine racemase